MELYLIRDKSTGTYYIKDEEPFFYAFHNKMEAREFCKSCVQVEIEEREIDGKADDVCLVSQLYQKGYKGGFIDGVFRPVNLTDPVAAKLFPRDSALLSLILYKRTGKLSYIENERFYFFVQVTEDGYLAFANTNGSIFAFTDMENMDTSLKNQLFDLGYKVIRYHMDNKHCYFINPRKSTSVKIENKQS